MKKILRSLSLFLVLVMLTSVFCGCSEKKDEGSSSSQINSEDLVLPEFPLKEPITIKAFSWYQGDFDAQKPLIKEFERLTNIKIEYDAPADGYDEKLSLLLTSGDWPDVMLIGTAGGRNVNEISTTYGKQGKFVKISDYVDKMPNLKAYYEKYPDSKTIFEDDDGSVYLFPYIYPYKTIPTGFFYNSKAFDAAGVKAPTNTDELFDAAKKLKEKFPSSYPVTSYTIAETLTVWGRVFNTAPSVYFNEEKDEYVYGPFENEFKQMLEYLNKLYSNKLYDPQFPQYTFAGDDWRQTLATQKSFITESYVWEMQYENANSVNTIAKNMNLSDKVDFKYMKPLSANGKESKYWGLTTVSPWYGMVINSSSPYVKEMLALLDWQLSDEFFNLLGYGIEGTTYKMENGKPVFMDDITTTGEAGKKPLADFMSFYAGLNIYEIYPDPLGWKSNLEKFTGYTMNQMGEFAKWPEPWTVTFDKDTKDKHGQSLTPASTMLEENCYKFISGKLSFDKYDKFISDLKAMGVEEAVKDYNNFYKTKVKVK